MARRRGARPSGADSWRRALWAIVVGVMGCGAALVQVHSSLPSSDRAPVEAVTLDVANQHFGQHRIAEAAKAYEAVVAHTENDKERARAEHRRALLDWWFYEQPEEARSRLLAAAERGVQASSLLALLAAVEIDRDRFEPAREAALRALLLAETEAETRDARELWARAVVQEALEARRAGEPTPDPKRLDEARRVLQELVADEVGARKPSLGLLRAGLLSGDGEAALAGWRSYFRVGPAGEIYNLLEEPLAELSEVLPGWRGGADSEATLRLVKALGASRFFEEAALVARELPEAETLPPRVAELVAYADFLRVVEETAERYYRRAALGETAPDELGRALLSELLSRWSDLGMPGEPPAVEPVESLPAERLREVMEGLTPVVRPSLADRFGTYVSLGNTAGYFDLHMGHSVLDEHHTVEQYGHTAEVRFILLDTMVSNGFQSWAWAYRLQHGGWAKPEAIYQVRPAYTDGPLEAWRELTDPEERRRWEEENRRRSEADLEIAARSPVAHLPGLEGRLHRAALEGLLEELRTRGFEGDELRRGFLAELEAATQDSSIFAHEGRHVIDKREGITASPELEFRAKLSEIAFARLPRAVMSRAILGSNLGGPTPHGQANQRVAEGLVEWMEKHAEEIEGLEADRPLFPQLDRLSPKQLRRAACSMDPLCPEE